MLAILATVWSTPAAYAAKFQTLKEYLGVPSVDEIGISAISADGSAFVGSLLVQSTPVTEYEPMFWSRKTGVLSFGPPMRRALGASANGTTITGDDGGASYVATLGGRLEQLPPGAFSIGLSADGFTAVGSQGGNLVTTPDSTPMRWTSAGGLELLGFLPGAEFLPLSLRFGEAIATSFDGSVVVGSSYGSYHDNGGCQNGCLLRQAFRWTPVDGMVSLGLGNAQFVSWDGNVVAGIGGPLGPAFVNRTFRWTPETGTVILGLPPGRRASVANGMSADGSILVGMLDDGGTADAFVWDAQHGMRELQQVLIDEYGLESELAGWHLLYALDMSADGNVILGVGRDPDGVAQRFVVVLNTVPEPSALLLALMAALALAMFARRRTA